MRYQRADAWQVGLRDKLRQLGNRVCFLLLLDFLHLLHTMCGQLCAANYVQSIMFSKLRVVNYVAILCGRLCVDDYVWLLYQLANRVLLLLLFHFLHLRLTACGQLCGQLCVVNYVWSIIV